MPIVNVTSPLDFWDILVNEVSGSLGIFVFLSTLIIMYLAAKFRMPAIISIMILCLWLILLVAEGGLTPLAIIVGIGIGIFVGWQVIKLFNR